MHQIYLVCAENSVVGFRECDNAIKWATNKWKNEYISCSYHSEGNIIDSRESTSKIKSVNLEGDVELNRVYVCIESNLPHESDSYFYVYSVWTGMEAACEIACETFKAYQEKDSEYQIEFPKEDMNKESDLHIATAEEYVHISVAPIYLS